MRENKETTDPAEYILRICGPYCLQYPVGQERKFSPVPQCFPAYRQASTKAANSFAASGWEVVRCSGCHWTPRRKG